MESGRLILKNPSSEGCVSSSIQSTSAKVKRLEEVATAILLVMSNLTHII
jgi:hypothetical protein